MKDPSQILEEVAETQERKDADYGEAWRLVGETLSLWMNHAGENELTIDADPDTLASLGLFTRRLDKLIRAFNGEFLGNDLNYESIRDSHADEAGYAGMHAALLAEQEPTTYSREPEPDWDEWFGEPHPIQTIEETITIGPISGEEDDLATEDEYDEALPIHQPYQEKYEELVRE